jgi:hypothetical protein
MEMATIAQLHASNCSQAAQPKRDSPPHLKPGLLQHRRVARKSRWTRVAALRSRTMYDWNAVALFAVIGIGMATSLTLFVRTVRDALRTESRS